MAWLTGWSDRVELRIASKYVDADITDFALLITEDHVRDDFWTTVKADGSDIAVTASDGTTKLDRYLIRLDTGAKSLVLRVRVPTVSSATDTVLYLYYGNSGATEANTTTTFRASCEGWWAFEDDPAGGTAYDLTANNHDGSISGTVSRVGSVVGYGWSFENGPTSGVRVSDSADAFSFTTGSADLPFSVVAFVRAKDDLDANGIVAIKGSGSLEQWNFVLNANRPELKLWTNGNGSSLVRKGTSTGILDNEPSRVSAHYHLIAATYDGSAASSGITLYVDGEVGADGWTTDDAGYTTMGPGGGDLGILGGPDGGGTNWGARTRTDELRIFTEELSAAEVKAMFLNEAYPTVFLRTLDVSIIPDVNELDVPIRDISSFGVRIEGPLPDESDLVLNVGSNSYSVASGTLETFRGTEKFGNQSHDDGPLLLVWPTVELTNPLPADDPPASCELLIGSTSLGTFPVPVTSIRSSVLAYAQGSCVIIPKVRSGISDATYTVFSRYSVSEGIIAYSVIDASSKLGVNVWYYVGTDVVRDEVGSMLPAHLELIDFAGEMLPRGYTLHDVPGEAIVQGYFVTDAAGNILVAVETLETPSVGMVLPAVLQLDDLPGCISVYVVDKGTIVDIMVIDSDTLAALTAMGVTLNDEVT